MDKRYLTVADVERSLLVYERTFGMSSRDFYDARYEGDEARIADVPSRHRFLWASLCRTLDRMNGGGTLAGQIERELEPA
jgi:hypothetical protein